MRNDTETQVGNTVETTERNNQHSLPRHSTAGLHRRAIASVDPAFGRFILALGDGRKQGGLAN